MQGSNIRGEILSISAWSLGNRDLLHRSIFDRLWRRLLQAWNRWKIFFLRDPLLVIQKATTIVGVSVCILWKSLRWEMNAKFYTANTGQKLTGSQAANSALFKGFIANDRDFMPGLRSQIVNSLTPTPYI